MKSFARGFGPRTLALGLVLALPAAALAADKIGVTSAAQNRVEGSVDGQAATPMRVGSIARLRGEPTKLRGSLHSSSYGKSLLPPPP